MRTLILAVCCGLLTSVAQAADPDARLQSLVNESGAIVSGEFTTDPISESDERGIVHYQASLRIERLLKSPSKLDKLRAGQTIEVSFMRYEIAETDRLPYVRAGGKALLFLREVTDASPRAFTTIDPWFGIQPASTPLVDTVARLSDQPSELLVEKIIETQPAKPAAQPKAPLSLEGEWRLFLPAGFEYEAILTKDRRDANCYELTPGGLTFGKRFEVHGDFVVSYPDDPSARRGVFRWKINSPYLLTLVEQPKNASGDYLGAVFTRHSPLMKARREAPQPTRDTQ